MPLLCQTDKHSFIGFDRFFILTEDLINNGDRVKRVGISRQLFIRCPRTLVIPDRFFILTSSGAVLRHFKQKAAMPGIVLQRFFHHGIRLFRVIFRKRNVSVINGDQKGLIPGKRLIDRQIPLCFLGAMIGDQIVHQFIIRYIRHGGNRIALDQPFVKVNDCRVVRNVPIPYISAIRFL